MAKKSMIPAGPTRSELDLRLLWENWGETERLAFLYWLELAFPHEERSLQAASFAASKVQEWRSQGRIDRMRIRSETQLLRGVA